MQGEGRYSGEPSVFVRTSGCNLRCWFCDTPYTSWNPEGENRSWDSIVEDVLQYDCTHVVITGGEPMLQAEVQPLAAALREHGKFITVETAGTVDLLLQADLMSISPKLSNSVPSLERAGEWRARHERDRHRPQVIRRLLRDYDYQLKFVIDQPSDLDEVEAYLAEIPEAESSHVWLMPQAVTAAALTEKSAWIEAAAVQRGYQFTSRLHIELYGNVRGK
ncbi:7-carboxy-7-deazaguanine synthase QueE [Symmachiella macrocystis]|uniref:7-carboxy-7-deazaguanine synthase QueE n=1 Tax=Symmachiella macrocystis TaxID=2527985 RepID=UPI0021BC6B8C|nr:7-carboxy-7-deazaguanine synthase QueE [Symmachiella macrocystis]